MNKEFVMRGQTASGGTETLNFSGHKKGYAYKITEFSLYPKVPNTSYEISGTITASKTAMDPAAINFNDQGLIATSFISDHGAEENPVGTFSVLNDTFLITQNLKLKVETTVGSDPINWQCRFMPVKLSGAEEAVVNYKQFTISDE
tara:strand:- start:261 stop:698 length:438 start_codon:yes stop_codon:yes gene_type:complete